MGSVGERDKAGRQSPWKPAARRLGAGAALAVLVAAGPVGAAGSGLSGDGAGAGETQPRRQLAQSREARRFDIPAQPLADALTVFGRQAGLQVTLDAAIAAGRSAPAVAGTMPPQEALRRLLVGSGITWHFSDGNTVALERPGAGAGSAAVVLDPIQVEGRGAAPPTADIGALPPEYAGGQVARGGRLGVLGNQDMMDVPFSMTSYTDTTIRNQQAETIADVMANDPSVRTGYGFGNFSERFVIRGFPLFGEDVAIDGLYGNAPRQIVGIEMFERVEVMKGANAFLNGVGPGSTGVGGGINLVPKRAGDAPLTRLTGNYAQNSRVGAHADLGRRFGRDGAFGVRVNAAARDGETSIDDEERYYHLASVALDYRGDRTRVTLDGGTQRQRIQKGRPVVFATAPVVPDAPSASSNYSPAYAYSDLEDSFLQARAEYDLAPKFTIHAALGVRDMREDGDYASPTVTDSAGNATVSRLTVPREDDNQSGQLGFRGEVASGAVIHRFNGGVAALHTVNRNAFEFSGAEATNIYNPASLGRPPTTFAGGDFDHLPKVSESTLRSVYLSDTLSFNDDQVLATVGVRHQKLHARGFDRTTFQESSNYNEEAVTPVLGLVVKPVSTVALYANRIEGLAQGPTAPGTSANPGEIFPPFTSVQYEVGGKLDLGTFGAGMTFFQTTQPSSVTDPVTNIFSVDGEQVNRGVELTMFGEPAPGLRLLGGVTLTSAVLEKTAGGTNDGNHAVGVPLYQANLGAEWDLPFLNRVTLSARLLHTAPQYLDAANTQEVPRWTRLDIGARVTRTIEGRDVVFRANVENITDEAYWASAQGGYLTQGNPLTAKVSVALDF